MVRRDSRNTHQGEQLGNLDRVVARGWARELTRELARETSKK